MSKDIDLVRLEHDIRTILTGPLCEVFPNLNVLFARLREEQGTGERDAIWALVLDYREAFEFAQDVQYFDIKRFERADALKKELWAMIEGKKQNEP